MAVRRPSAGRFTLAPDETVLYQPDAGTLLADRGAPRLRRRRASRPARPCAKRTAVESVSDDGRTVSVETAGRDDRCPRCRRRRRARGRHGSCPGSATSRSCRRARRWPTFARRTAGRSRAWSTTQRLPTGGRAAHGQRHLRAFVTRTSGSRSGFTTRGQSPTPTSTGVPDPEWWLGRPSGSLPVSRLPTPSRRAVETCLYTNTADESFVLERHGRVVVASACSGHAFKFAPALARTVAALADRGARVSTPVAQSRRDATATSRQTLRHAARSKAARRKGGSAASTAPS